MFRPSDIACRLLRGPPPPRTHLPTNTTTTTSATTGCPRRKGLPLYAARRNDPMLREGTSRLSAYHHWWGGASGACLCSCVPVCAAEGCSPHGRGAALSRCLCFFPGCQLRGLPSRGAPAGRSFSAGGGGAGGVAHSIVACSPLPTPGAAAHCPRAPRAHCCVKAPGCRDARSPAVPCPLRPAGAWCLLSRWPGRLPWTAAPGQPSSWVSQPCSLSERYTTAIGRRLSATCRHVCWGTRSVTICLHPAALAALAQLPSVPGRIAVAQTQAPLRARPSHCRQSLCPAHLPLSLCPCCQPLGPLPCPPARPAAAFALPICR